MSRSNLVAAAVWAGGAFGLTLAVLAPAHLNATSPAPVAPLVMDAAKLAKDGAELCLQYAGKSATVETIPLRSGDSLPLALAATNTQDRTVEVQAKIVILSRSLASELSRVMPTQMTVWQQEELLVLAPRETRTIALSPNLKLDPGSSISVQLICGEQAIQPLRFFVEREPS